MSVTLGDLCDGVASTLAPTPGIKRTQSYDELTEGYPDCPMIQVYPETGVVDANGGNTDRTSFRGGTRVGEYGITADLIVRQRSQLGEDMALATVLIDAVTTILEQEKLKPYFGVDGIKAFRWAWQRTLFLRDDPAVTYVGARFTITLVMF